MNEFDIINYRHTGLSLNHILGCPLNCAYCVRHFWNNFNCKTPFLINDDNVVIETLLKHRWFEKDAIPIELLHQGTDPFLPNVKEHMFNILSKIDELGYSNIITLITRYKITEEDILRLERYKNIRIVIFFTYSGMNNTLIEPIISTKFYNETFHNMKKYRKNIKFVLYWRPIVKGWNDDDGSINRVLDIIDIFDAAVIKGLRLKKENYDYMKQQGIPLEYEYGEFKKIFPDEIENKIREMAKIKNIKVPILNKTSCGIANALKIGDYNKQYNIINCSYCTSTQQKLCESVITPTTEEQINNLFFKLGKRYNYKIYNNQVEFFNMSKEDKFFSQHYLGCIVK